MWLGRLLLSNVVGRILFLAAFVVAGLVSPFIDQPLAAIEGRVQPTLTQLPSECSATREPDVPTSGVVNLSSNVKLTNNGFVTHAVCSAGVITLRAHGSSYEGVGPRVVVAFGASTLWEGNVTELVELEFWIDGPGWLGVGFVNDESGGGEDRNLWVEEIGFAPR